MDFSEVDFNATAFYNNVSHPREGWEVGDGYLPIASPWDVLAPGDMVTGYVGRNLLAISFLIGVFGAIVAFELLWRRSNVKGIRNYLYLFNAALMMGGAEVGMQHLAFRAMNMGWGSESLTIVQGPWFFLLSIFTPTILYLIAFGLMGADENRFTIRSACAGLVAGCTTTGSTFLSQYGVSNYIYKYDWKYASAASVISFIGTAFSIWLFNHLRSYFNNMWNKNLFLAIVVASSMVTMHWVLNAGSVMFTTKDNDFSNNYVTHNIFTAVTYLFGMMLSVGIVATAAYGRRYRKTTTRRTVHLMLASLTITYDGKIMVHKDGTIPCEKVMDIFEVNSAELHLDVRSDTFSWLWRASRDWTTVMGLIPLFQVHSRFLIDHAEENLPSNLSAIDLGNYIKESVVFAAQRIADTLHTPLETVGHLHDEFLKTGNHYEYLLDSENDVERLKNCTTQFKGRLITLVRRIGPAEVARMEPLGFRFTDMENVKKILAWETQTTKGKVCKYLKSAIKCTNDYDPRVLKGTYVGCFATRPSLLGGFEIAVDPECHTQIPMSRVEVDIVPLRYINYFMRYEDQTILEVFTGLQKDFAKTKDPRFKQLLKSFIIALQHMIGDVNKELWAEAQFRGKPSMAICRATPGEGAKALVFAFQTMLPADGPAEDKLTEIKFVPYQHLTTLQRVSDRNYFNFHMRVVKEYVEHTKTMQQALDQEEADSRFMGLTRMFTRRGSDSSGSRHSVWSMYSDDEKQQTTRGWSMFQNGTKVKHIEQYKKRIAEGDPMKWKLPVPSQDDIVDDESYIENFFKSTVALSQRNRMKNMRASRAY
ncbi:hypothetical protein DFH27DRAFT_628480 [Peziza echinospora]|nr:hypothetical protein DFH27DRAFT_628480 [Peziza echinospora]